MSLQMAADIKALRKRLDEFMEQPQEEVPYDFVVDWCKCLEERLEKMERLYSTLDESLAANLNRIEVDVTERLKAIRAELDKKANRAGRKPKAKNGDA